MSSQDITTRWGAVGLPQHVWLYINFRGDKVMFCKHKWKMLSDKTTESQFEHSMNTAYKYSNAIKLPHQLCDAERKVIQILSCEKCGKLKKLVETI